MKADRLSDEEANASVMESLSNSRGQRLAGQALLGENLLRGSS